jgi:hypothetical protein
MLSIVLVAVYLKARSYLTNISIILLKVSFVPSLVQNGGSCPKREFPRLEPLAGIG